MAKEEKKGYIFCTNLFSSTTVPCLHPRTYNQSVKSFFFHQFCLFEFISGYNPFFACRPSNPFHFACQFKIKVFSGQCSLESREYRRGQLQICHTNSWIAFEVSHKTINEAYYFFFFDRSNFGENPSIQSQYLGRCQFFDCSIPEPTFWGLLFTGEVLHRCTWNNSFNFCLKAAFKHPNWREFSNQWEFDTKEFSAK